MNPLRDTRLIQLLVSSRETEAQRGQTVFSGSITTTSKYLVPSAEHLLQYLLGGILARIIFEKFTDDRRQV